MSNYHRFATSAERLTIALISRWRGGLRIRAASLSLIPSRTCASRTNHSRRPCAVSRPFRVAFKHTGSKAPGPKPHTLCRDKAVYARKFLRILPHAQRIIGNHPIFFSAPGTFNSCHQAPNKVSCAAAAAAATSRVILHHAALDIAKSDTGSTTVQGVETLSHCTAKRLASTTKLPVFGRTSKTARAWRFGRNSRA